MDRNTLFVFDGCVNNVFTCHMLFPVVGTNVTLRKLHLLSYRKTAFGEKQLRIADECLSKWRDIGKLVGVIPGTPGNYGMNQGDASECLRIVFSKWMEEATCTSHKVRFFLCLATHVAFTLCAINCGCDFMFVC